MEFVVWSKFCVSEELRYPTCENTGRTGVSNYERG